MIQIDPAQPNARAAVPEYLPARMLNEFVYCPRLFYYEWVESPVRPQRRNGRRPPSDMRKSTKLRTTCRLPLNSWEATEAGRARSIELASDTYRITAKMDLVEAQDGRVTPVDYKRGRPAQSADGTLEAWDADRVQLAAQAIVLRENGYQCLEGVIYYAATKQRVRVAMDDTLLAFAQRSIGEAFATASGPIPPPLEDSPKCPRCSLVNICLPDETRLCRRACVTSTDGESEVRRLLPARDDLRPL
jgi:CRISPR-associated protein Cas1